MKTLHLFEPEDPASSAAPPPPITGPTSQQVSVYFLFHFSSRPLFHPPL